VRDFPSDISDDAGGSGGCKLVSRSGGFKTGEAESSVVGFGASPGLASAGAARNTIFTGFGLAAV
jgi:hypothetical protein